MNKVLRGSAASVVIGVALCSSAAYAQQPPSVAVPATTPEAASPSADQDIVVTGSRIARANLESTSPITVVTAQQIQTRAASANIENVINDLPQVTPTTSSTSNNPGGGVATLNLRNLGDQRTLVLVNGRRYMSFDTTQIVDINTIPSALIERIDVVTGGQSAVYGSDAIAGVVNFVLKHNFEGVEVNSSYNFTSRGDGQLFDVNGAIGTNFGDNRGNVTIYAQYTKRKATLAGARGFSTDALSDNEDGTPPYVGAGSGSTPNGRINIPGLDAATGLACPSSNTQSFDPSGLNHCYTAADSYNFNPVNYLQVPQTRYLVHAQAEYEISEHFRPYMEAEFSNNRVTTQLAATPITSGSPYGASTTGLAGGFNQEVMSQFLAPSFRTALAALDATQVGTSPEGIPEVAGDGYVYVPSWNYRTTALGGRVNVDERNAYRIVAGMKGDIGLGFNYDGYYMYTRTTDSQRQLGNVAVDRFLNAITTTGGGTACASAAAVAQGCVPADIFGNGNLSQAAVDYIGVGATNLTAYHTQVANMSITNPNIYDLGAGPIGVAFGFEYRVESGSDTPDTFLASGNVAGFNSGQPTSGSYNVREFFGEIRVPLLRDKIVHRFELNGAIRQSKYSNAAGNVLTYAGGGELEPIQGITFRGQYQKAVRSPSVSELYLGNTVSFGGNADQCGTPAATAAGTLNDICVAQFTAAGAPLANIGNPGIQTVDINPVSFEGGNPNLKEETAKTYTLGVVVQPKFLRHATLTVDYYHIDLQDAILSGVGPDVIGQACFGQGNQAFCNLIQRNAVGEIASFNDRNVNSGGIKTKGIDIDAGYSMPLGNVMSQDAKVSFALDGSYLLKYTFTPVAGIVKYQCAGAFGANCGVPTPHWRHVFRTTLGLGSASLTGTWRYIGPAHDDDNPRKNPDGSDNPGTLYGSEHFKSVSYFDLTASFDVAEHYSFNVGVTNLLDKKPPLAASTQQGGNGEQSNTFPTLYDVLGRAFFVSGRLKF